MPLTSDVIEMPLTSDVIYTHILAHTDLAVRPSLRNPKFVQPLLYPSLEDHEVSQSTQHIRYQLH